MTKLEKEENFLLGFSLSLSLCLSLSLTIDFLKDDFYILKIPFLLWSRCNVASLLC